MGSLMMSWVVMRGFSAVEAFWNTIVTALPNAFLSALPVPTGLPRCSNRPPVGS